MSKSENLQRCVSFFVASIEEGFVVLDEVAGFRYISSNGCQM
jgi:hypothetical protein